MKKKILIISFIIVIVIVTLFVVISIYNDNTYDYKKTHNNYEGKGQKSSLEYNGEIITSENVKIYNEDIEVFYGETYVINVTYAHIPLMPILRHIGAKVNWITDYFAIITMKDSKYVLNLKNLTFKKIGIWQDMIIPTPGTEVFYCNAINNDIILDDTTIKSLMKQICGSCHVTIDETNLVVNVETGKPLKSS
ncbi:MAG: hypothetical protein J6A95_00895 [Clostridia bacterium]|nr:hypothetical protein [Clostridia bacterium]